ncbi:hypothetical protein [Thioalkalivibrio sp. HK1]|uniref:hypothetical protein n=1 Tax=Thioalkalivibrio sp. HK1 TaxID=1469245 RepID=UPI00046FC603|nr:hypothetical protein [Thioalkalivibrio sp. HK1]
MSNSESIHPNGVEKRIEDRQQADSAGRLAALERLAGIAEARAVEERQENREERRANRIERRVAWSVYGILVLAVVGAIASLGS